MIDRFISYFRAMRIAEAARTLARHNAKTQRDMIRQKTREMRDRLGLPPIKGL